MWVEDVDDITVEFEQDGVLVVKEEDKRIVTKGTWATIAFLYRDYKRKEDDYGPLKMSLRKYRKQGGTYRQQAKFNIGSVKQAKAIAEVLVEWSNRE